jgi:hypothetical protein
MRAYALLPFLLSAALAQNQGLSLQSGTTNYLDVPFSPTLVPSGGVTVEAWVTYGATPLQAGWCFPTIVRMDPSPNQSSFFLRVEAGQTSANRLLWWVSTTNGDFTINWFFNPGALIPWTHVAATYDGATMAIVVNGVQVAQGPATGTIQNRGGTFRIGSGDQTIVGGETWNGQIDEVRLWPFGRSAAAIASTMNQSLALMPGEVSTWNLDGNAQDSSGANHGTVVGTPAFAINTLSLTSVPFPGAINFGTASGCRGNGLAAIAAVANVGNGGFGIAGTRAPASAGGLLLLSLGSLSTPLPLLGTSIYVNLAAAGTSLFLTSSAVGTGLVPIPVPQNPTLVGLGLDAQFLWLDATCPAGLSASNAVFASVQP